MILKELTRGCDSGIYEICSVPARTRQNSDHASRAIRNSGISKDHHGGQRIMDIRIGRRTVASPGVRVNARRRGKRARARDERGQALLEFAYLLPILVTLMLGMIVFGIALNNYLEMTNGVAAGAQALSISRGQTTDPCKTVTARLTQQLTTLRSRRSQFTITISGLSPPARDGYKFRKSCANAANPTCRRQRRYDTGRHCHGNGHLSVQSQGLRNQLRAQYLHVDGANCGEHPMKRQSKSFVRPVRDGQRGQSLAFVALLLPVLLGLAAIVVDLGNSIFPIRS